MSLKKINFRELYIRSSLFERRALKKFLISIFDKELHGVETINIIFCTDVYLHSLNKRFLNHDYYTDTLSFLLSTPLTPIVGDIYISVDRVSENAKNLNILYKTELLRVIIHSCLHLCGYTDKPKKAFNKMYRVQEMYLKEWFVSRETSIGG